MEKLNSYSPSGALFISTIAFAKLIFFAYIIFISLKFESLYVFILPLSLLFILILIFISLFFAFVKVKVTDEYICQFHPFIGKKQKICFDEIKSYAIEKDGYYDFLQIIKKDNSREGILFNSDKIEVVFVNYMTNKNINVSKIKGSTKIPNIF